MDKQNLEETLNAHGLTVLLTHDHTAMLRELARLARFERWLVTMSSIDPGLAYILGEYSTEHNPPTAETVPIQIADVPLILREISRDLHRHLDTGTAICPDRLPAARVAFLDVLTAA